MTRKNASQFTPLHSKKLTVNQPPHGFEGSSPSFPTSFIDDLSDFFALVRHLYQAFWNARTFGPQRNSSDDIAPIRCSVWRCRHSFCCGCSISAYQTPL